MTVLASKSITAGITVCDSARALGIWIPSLMNGPIVDVSLNLRTKDDDWGCSLREWERVTPDRIIVHIPPEYSIEYWDMEHPHLYRLVGEVVTENQTVGIGQNIGFRWLATTSGRIYLNSKPIYLRGCIRGISAHTHPNFSGASNKEWHEKSIRQAKAFGFNLVRWHSTIPDEDYLNEADRLGILVQVELGFIKKGNRYVVDTDRWKEMISKLCHHPSVGIYCIGNEIRRPGSVPQIRKLVEMAKRLDPSTLVTDSCGWGEPDRPAPDVYCQHVAYFFPYAEHKTMFDRIDSFKMEGYCDTAHTPVSGTPGSIDQPLKPVIAHEVCHYITLRNVKQMREKWRNWRKSNRIAPDHPGYEFPWWAEELEKLYREKGMLDDELSLRKAADEFQALCHKHAFESIRRSSTLQGFEMLQLADCWKYENQNGLLDCFDDSNYWDPAEFASFNGDTVLLTDFDERTFTCGEPITFPVIISHYGSEPLKNAILSVWLENEGKILATVSSLSFPEIRNGRVSKLTEITLRPKDIPSACKAILRFELKHGQETYRNKWAIWLFPKKDNLQETPKPPKIVHELTHDIIKQIDAGDRLLWLYRPAYLFNSSQSRPSLDFNGRQDLFKPVIWDRGDNLGAVVRPHPALSELPHDGFADWQFAPLIHHGCKINLDGFPVPIQPIVQGVDRPVRDRMEVMQHGKSEFQADHTCRKWGWLFELAIGKGRLLVCGFNLTRNKPVCNFVLDRLLAYTNQPSGEASARIHADTFIKYLRTCGSQPRSAEPPMTQYWLEDNEPVETQLFWEKLGITLK